MRYAYSRSPADSQGCKHVQDRLYHDRADVIDLFDKGCKMFVCGGREVGEGVQEACVRIARERSCEIKGVDVPEEEVRRWWEGLRNERFATDVFA